MRITLRDAWIAQTVLLELGRISFAPKLSYKIGRITSDVTRECEAIEKQRVKMIEAYDHKAEAGGFSVPQDKLPEFQAAFAELLTQETEVWGHPIKLSELGEKEIAAGIFANCGWMFVEAEEEKEGAKGAANG